MSAVALVPLTDQQRSQFEWLEAPHLKKIVAALETVEPGAARYVGGCVRDSLLAERPKDVDIATLLPPEKVMNALLTAGLGAAPTGIEHGTITAIADHKGVEITTLRADLSTDGRRANVAFTHDWEVDAQRRDFRVNAIYLTPDGRLFDPVGGMADMAAKRVRFIGEAEHRIKEDYLRILRFFRFTARLSKDFDAIGLAACAKLKDGIGQLSAERIGVETMAILSLPRAVMALKAMKKTGVLTGIWNGSAALEAVQRLKDIAPGAIAPLVLAALFGEGGEGVGSKLRLSNAEKAIRSNALRGIKSITRDLSDADIRVLIYKLGKDIFHDSIALAYSRGVLVEAGYKRMLKFADEWTPPKSPISGRHILAAGVSAGPEIAKLLLAVERQWIEEGFPDDARTHQILKAIIAERG